MMDHETAAFILLNGPAAGEYELPSHWEAPHLYVQRSEDDWEFPRLAMDRREDSLLYKLSARLPGRNEYAWSQNAVIRTYCAQDIP